MEVPQNVKNRATIRPSKTTSGTISKGSENWIDLKKKKEGSKGFLENKKELLEIQNIKAEKIKIHRKVRN